MTRLRLLSICLAVALVMGLVMSACARPAPTPAPATKAAPAPAPKTTVAPAPTTKAAPAPKTTVAPAPTTKPAPATETAADFYKKNPVTLICTMAPGGGTDFASRIVAAHWADVSDGGFMKVQNMPGGGTLVGMNYVYKAKPDGLTWGMNTVGTGFTLPKLYKDPGMQFDPAKFNIIGWWSAGQRVFGVGKQLPYQSIEDLKKVKGLKMAVAGGKTADKTVGSALLINLFGLDGVVITGFAGTAECSLAVARGEVQGYVISAGTYKEEYDKGIFKKPLAVVSLEKDKVWPDTPTIPELMKLTPEQEKLIMTYDAIMMASQATFTSPGVPADRVKFIRDAWAKMVNLKHFQQTAALRYMIWHGSTAGEAAQAALLKMLATTDADLAALTQATEKYIR